MTHSFRWFNGAEDYGQGLMAYGDQVLPASWSVVTTPTVHSRRAFKWTFSNTSAELEAICFINTDARWNYLRNSGMAQLWVSFHLYIDTLPGAGQYCYFARFVDAATVTQFRIDENGALQVYNSNGASWGTASTGRLTPGVWYMVSIKHYTGGEVRVIARASTGSAAAEATHANVTSATGPQYCRIGATSASYGTFYVDNIVTEGGAVGTVDDPFNALGFDYSVLQLLVDGQGADNSGFTNAYTEVDENPKDDNASYREITYGLGVSTHTVKDPDVEAAAVEGLVIDTIAGVAVECYVLLVSNPSGMSGHCRLRRGAGAWNNASGFGASRAVYSGFWYGWWLDPTDSQPWTISRVSESEAGMQADAVAGTQSRWTANYMEVLATYRLTGNAPERLLHYILDVNDPRQAIRDQYDQEVPPEELRPNRWLAVVGWREPRAQPVADYINDPEKLPINSVRFTEPDDYSLGSGTDDLLDSVLARITQRSA